MIRISVIFIVLCLHGTLKAEAVAANSFASFNAQYSKATKQLKILVSTPKDTKLNYDGPWNFKILDQDKKQLHSSKLEHFNKDTHTFTLEKQEQLPVSYQITYFLCDKDGAKWCKREVANGNITAQ